MGILSNPKHEAFAQALARGLTQEAAHAEAGYKPSRFTASRLATKDNIQQRVAELLSEAAKRSAKTLDDVLAEYERIAFTGMSRFVKIDENGLPQIDLRDCTPADLDLLGDCNLDILQMSKNAPEQVVKIKIKTLDRLKALDKLASYLGMSDEAANQSKDRLAYAIASLARKGSAAPIATASRRDP